MDEDGKWKGLKMRNFIVFRGDESRSSGWTKHVARIGQVSDAFKMLTGKPTGKILIGRPRRRWEHNIKMNLKGMGVNTSNWNDSA